MKNFFTLILIAVMGIGCASGQNKYFNNEQTLGLGGGLGAGVGAFALTKNMKGTNRALVIGASSLLGYLLGAKVGSYFDKRDQDRQVKLINSVLEDNPDNVSSTDVYQKSWVNPNTGKSENHTVTQRVTPLRTYQTQIPNSFYAQRGNHLGNDNWYTGSQQSNNSGVSVGKNPYSGGYRNGQSVTTCREFTIDLQISKELLGTQQDTKTQYYNGCRQQNGWRVIQ